MTISLPLLIYGKDRIRLVYKSELEHSTEMEKSRKGEIERNTHSNDKSNPNKKNE